MLQTCLGIYFALAIPSFLVLWTALVMAKLYDEKYGQDSET